MPIWAWPSSLLRRQQWLACRYPWILCSEYRGRHECTDYYYSTHPSPYYPSTHQPVPQSVPTPTPPTPTGGEFCCTDDFLNCRSETDYCSESESNCNNCNSNWMIPQGQCIARWGDCGNDPSGWLLQPWAVHAVAQWAARSMPRKWRLLSVHEGLIRRV